MSASSSSNGRETETSALRDTLLSVFEQSLRAQVSAIRRLRAGAPVPEAGPAAGRRRRKRRSQVDLAEDILKEAGSPLHLTEIISRIQKTTGVQIDPESLGSALCKRIARHDRFRRTSRNTFALL